MVANGDIDGEKGKSCNLYNTLYDIEVLMDESAEFVNALGELRQ
jgi:hypothetical protein